MYPIFLNLDGKKCLVVGGGRVAVRKVIALLRAGAKVTVVAKKACSRLRSIAGRITLYERSFENSDLDAMPALVIGATDDPDVNRTISRLAAERNILCNIVDQPSLCSFFVPAQIRRGPITIAISTGGCAPRMSRYIKTVVATTIDPMYGELAEYMAEVRKRIGSAVPSTRKRNECWEAIFATDPIKEIKEHGWEAIRLRTEHLIDEYSRGEVGTE